MALPVSDPAVSYPIGQYDWEYHPTDEEFKAAIQSIRDLPADLRKAVGKLNDEQLDTPYRDGGWTIRQVVHHIADSHAHAFIRMRLALTEDNPTVKTYSESDWAELPDTKNDVEPSLQMIEGMHSRMAGLMASLDADRLARTFYHPERKNSYTLQQLTGVYGWHSKHHLAHITNLIRNKGW